MTNIAMEKIGKPSINGPCSMAMLNNQRVNHGKHSVEVDASVLILWMDKIHQLVTNGNIIQHCK